jgi:hypothetical protein
MICMSSPYTDNISVAIKREEAYLQDREEECFHDREEVTILDIICTRRLGGWYLCHHNIIFEGDH